jgi:hypothetical protein
MPFSLKLGGHPKRQLPDLLLKFLYTVLKLLLFVVDEGFVSRIRTVLPQG